MRNAKLPHVHIKSIFLHEHCNIFRNEAKHDGIIMSGGIF